MRVTASAVLLVLLCGSAWAIDRLEISLGNIEAASWRLDDIGLELNLESVTKPVLTVSAAALVVADQRIENLRLHCTSFQFLSGEVQCRNGRLDLDSDWLQARAASADFNYRFDSGELRVTVAGLPVAGGTLRLALRHQGDGWQLDAGLGNTGLAGLHALLARAGLDLPPLNYQGSVNGSLAASGDRAGVRKISWQLQTQGAGYSNSTGDQAAEALQLSSDGNATPANGDWRIAASLNAQKGMLYAEPLYLEFSGQQPLTLDARLHWRNSDRRLRIDSLDFAQPQVANGALQAVLQPGGETLLHELELQLQEAWLPGLYVNWLQPWLAAGVLGSLETSGRLHGTLSLHDGRPRAIALDLDRVTVREKAGLFAVSELDAAIDWDDSGRQQVSSLAWQGAGFRKLELGAARAQLETGATQLKLQQPVVVPMLDGALHVDQFELGLDAGGQLQWLLDGLLTPVSMKAFSAALDWPPLSGKLSGMIPKVRYENGELSIGGVLLVQAFDGDITVRKLRIQQPLGLAPRLWADAQIKNLDLETLTRTFSFGRIEGRFEGEVKDLYMEAWQPVGFDARFGTPPDDSSRHRISQKAVDNISNLGGSGMGGALSRSFLHVLEDFPYKRLGIRCRLENGVCAMGGIAAAKKGYYLVEGTMLPPRLDVVGYSDQVDWTSLVERLVAATRGGAATTR